MTQQGRAALRKGRNRRDRAALIAGALSLVTGGLMTIPSIWSVNKLSRPGIALTEFPVIPLGLGAAAVRMSRGRQYRLGGWMGLAGATMALRPLFHVYRTARHNEQAMRDGFGLTDGDLSDPYWVRSRANVPVTMLRRHRVMSRVRVTHNVPYGSGDAPELVGDLYEPLAESGLRPGIIAVHGGGWNGGNKGGFFEAHYRWLARQGYVIFDINYRLSPAVIWPGHLQDVKTAIRWLRINATRYQVDPDHIAIMGRSAGGHLALMAAFTSSDPDVAATDGLSPRDDVQAVIAVYPPTDLPLLQETVIRSLSYWMGGTLADMPDAYAKASPVHVVRPDAPPVLLAHGGHDTLVVPEHSRRLCERLRELNVPSAYLYYPWGRHGFDFSLSGLGGHMLQYDIDRFLSWALKRTRN